MKTKSGWKKFFAIVFAALGAAFVGLSIIAKKKKTFSNFDNEPEQKNPMEGKRVVFVEDEDDKENADGVCGHLVAVGEAEYHPSFYEKYIKRGMDIILSFGGLVVLSPVFLGIVIAIVIDDPGPVLFTQKRMGQNKKYFKLHKFRSMKMCTPHDVPTHMLDNPDQYITRVGAFLRSHSLDELPQIWDIFLGNMSVIGPRPGLWNQDVLTAERDKYGANDVKPGLTGWAQINGRDELEIPDKARLDGEYVKNIGIKMDVKCFLGSIGVFGGDESVVEGGTGEMKKNGIDLPISRHYLDNKSNEELIGNIGFGKPVEVDKMADKKVLITGAGSYIGESFSEYAKTHYPNLKIEVVDMIDGTWKDYDFSRYEIVYHVAGIAHADIGNVDDATKEKYYSVNTDLAVEVCKKAKTEGVKTFIFMSSMIVYGESAPYGQKKVINFRTVPSPANFYGDSKLQADVAVRSMANDSFKVIVLRPPMIYGKNSKGNYPTLAKMAKKLPVFPDVDNERSMLYIDNLCEFLCQIILLRKMERNSVVLFPQNKEWTRTSDMVQTIADVNCKKVIELKALRLAVAIGSRFSGKIGGLINKAFGNNCYSHKLSEYEGISYQNVSLRESLYQTEGNRLIQDSFDEKPTAFGPANNKKSILVVTQYFHPENFRINDICQEWVKRGHKVTVVTGIPNYPMGKTFEGYGLFKRKHEFWNGIEIYRIPLIPRGSSSVGMIMNYLSFMFSGILAGKLKHIKADMIFSFEVSPMTQVLAGISFAKKMEVPHYLYVQDLWPDNVVSITGITSPLIIKPIDKMVDYIYKNSDKVFVASPSFEKSIRNREVPVPLEKVIYWPQYAEDVYLPIEKNKALEEVLRFGILDDDCFKVVFAGNIGTAQGLDILPKTAALLKEKNVRFVIVGDGRYLNDFVAEVEEKDVADKFIMISRQPAGVIPSILAACDTAFISFADNELWKKTIPAKLQSYMACGMPVIAAAEGETERIIREANCGICCPMGDEKALSDSILEMMKRDLVLMSRNSREYYEKNFDKQMLMDRMEDFLEEIK